MFNETNELAEVFVRVAESLLSDNLGMMFCGDVGNGKSTMAVAVMRLVNYLIDNDYLEKSPGENDYHHFIRINAMDIPERWVASPVFRDDVRKRLRLVIDDLGEEPYELIDFGMPVHPMLDILMHRYDYMVYTITTTNLTMDEIMAKYHSGRLMDRINESLDIIVFNGESFR